MAEPGHRLIHRRGSGHGADTRQQLASCGTGNSLSHTRLLCGAHFSGKPCATREGVCATLSIAPALIMGNAVVFKPASNTPLTAFRLVEALHDAGLPPGVLNVLPASRERSVAIVTALLKDPRVRKLSFTGSTETGRLLLSQAAQNIVKCSMELGGNAPFIVFADADIDNAVSSAIVAKLRNGGQSCTAANRFYAERPIAEEFAKRLAGAMREMKVGYGLDDGVQIGPLINEATRGKVSSLVHDAVQQGARALCGAEAPAHKGYFYQPTVLTGVQDDMPIMRREIFGPVAPIVTFEGEHPCAIKVHASLKQRINLLAHHGQSLRIIGRQIVPANQVFRGFQVFLDASAIDRQR